MKTENCNMINHNEVAEERKKEIIVSQRRQESETC